MPTPPETLMSDYTIVLGPRVRRYRTSVSPLAVAWYLSIGPLLLVACAVAVMFFGRGPELIVIGAATGLLMLAISIVFLAWCTSAYLDLHPHGVVLGRTVLGGRPRAMWFTEIHPASIRVFSDIDTIRPLRGGQRMLYPSWHFSPGADLAVTFLGPDPGGDPAPFRARPPQPVAGLAIFGSREAEQIAAALREGLERGGCPPHLARWSAQFGIQELKGTGLRAQGQIPGKWADWTP